MAGSSCRRPRPTLPPCRSPCAALSRSLTWPKPRRSSTGGMHLWNAGIFLFSTTAILEAFAASHAPEVLWPPPAPPLRQSETGPLLHAPRACALGGPPRHLDRLRRDGARAEPERRPLCGRVVRPWRLAGGLARGRELTPRALSPLARRARWTAHDTLLQATSEAQQLVGIGLKDIIAVAMPDAVLVAHKDRAQEVKQAVAALKANSAPQAETLPRDYRPWGWYESLVVGPRFQVKRIVVHPGAALSLAKPPPPRGTLDRRRGHCEGDRR